jgi:hypothetical protein
MLANDVVIGGELPRASAETMSIAAKDVSVGLSALLRDDREKSSTETLRMIKHAQIDLEALGDLASLALRYDLTAKNAVHLALALRFTAERIMDALKLLQNDTGG